MSPILPTTTDFGKNRPLAKASINRSNLAAALGLVNDKPLRYKSAPEKRGYYTTNPDGSYRASWSTFLRHRSRTTNLAVLLLSATACLSVLINIRMYWNDSVFRVAQLPNSVPASLSKSVPQYASSLSHLILVPCHAIYIGYDTENSDVDDQWVLQDVQKGGSVQTFIKQLTQGVKMAAQDQNSLLIFSGGMTRHKTQQTEAQSYLRYAEDHELFQQHLPGSSSPFPRATTEIFAMDSYQNLLFSVARFKEVTGRWPEHITVIGFGMKRQRFEDVHRAAMRWPRHAFSYVGIDDEGNTNQNYEGELQYGLRPFMQDTYGCRGELLAKRRSRNPYNRFHPYFTSTPELAQLIEYCPSEATRTFKGRLPWG